MFWCCMNCRNIYFYKVLALLPNVNSILKTGASKDCASCVLGVSFARVRGSQTEH